MTIIKNFPYILHGGDWNPDQWLEHPEIIDQAKKEFAQRAAEGYTCPIPDDAVPIAIEL